MITKSDAPFRWEGVDVYPYKETGTHFRSITRQTLFGGEGDLPVELRYFEITDGGHSTLERHDHTHLVMIVRGGGNVLVGEDVREIFVNDVVRVPAWTWHQFQAHEGGDLGFLCVVAVERDRPTRPQSADELPEAARGFARL